MGPIYRRSRPPPIQTDNLNYQDDDGLSRKRSLLPNAQAFLALFVLVAISALATQNTSSVADNASYQTVFRVNENNYRTELSPGVSLSLVLARVDDSTGVRMGPHSIEVSFQEQSKECQLPRVWARVMGDALISIPTKPLDPLRWLGDFSFPLEGKYRIEVRWTVCETMGSLSVLTIPMNFTVSRHADPPPPIMRKPKSSESIFQEGLWLSSAKFNTEGETSQPYIWHDRKVNANDTTLIKASSSRGQSLVSKEATFIPQEFRDLSNYELVCWVGSDSAASIREAFLSLRPELFRNQRPFKFHYYNVTSFEKPDQHWDEELKKKFRKCKTILVSADELDEAPLTQAEYKRQVTTFLSHIVKAIPDPTFPIWMVTVNESPTTTLPMCTVPSLPSGNHPCNDVLFDFWKEKTFPPRVKLLDTIDLVDPQFGENQNDIIAVIAMRIYSLVGTQVATWRTANQIGKVDGLHRDNNVEPNPKEVPYDWTGKAE